MTTRLIRNEPARAPLHRCHRPGCARIVDPKMLACGAHWRELPQALRNAIWREYRPGQEIDKRPSETYLEAAGACEKWWREKDADGLRGIVTG